jgi:predicted ferric reductase
MAPITRAILWFGVYLILIVFPLIVGANWPGEAASRPFWLQFGVACGFVAFSIMAFEFALISKVQSVASAFGQDVLLQFHRQMGMVASVLILVHAVLMFLSGYPLAWLNPLDATNIWAMRWGVLAALAILILMIVSLGRRRLRFSYDSWQLTHGFLAETAVLFSLMHLLMFSGFSAGSPMRLLLGGYCVLLLALRIWFVVIKPVRMWSRPWEVVENIPEHGNSRTLLLKPVGHAGFAFEPGQFAWLSARPTPFHRGWHPISMSSCARDEPGHNIAFTIKNLGDWSGQIVPALQPGRRIWVDGPYGVFTPEREQGPGYVLIGGGAGITPLYSMCQTFAERGDARPVLLFFAGRTLESLTFAEQFEGLRKRMNLKVIYVLEHPPENWDGETGHLSAAMLRKHLPRQYRRYEYFICGPPGLMDAMEKSLVEIGVDARHVHTERFDWV